MFARNVPKFFWGDAMLTTAYLINRMPAKSLNSKTPIDILKQHLSHINCLDSLPPKVFGCTIFVYIPNKNGSKLDPKATKYIFLGYSPTQKRVQVLSSTYIKEICLHGCKCFWKPTLLSEIWSLGEENIARRSILDASFTHLESCYWTWSCRGDK